MIERKKCPCCGGYSQMMKLTPPDGRTTWQINCRTCGLSISRQDYEAVIRAWNRRENYENT